MPDDPVIAEVGMALVRSMHEAIHRAQARGLIHPVSQGVFLITDPDLIAVLRYHFEKQMTFRGIDVLSTKGK